MNRTEKQDANLEGWILSLEGDTYTQGNGGLRMKDKTGAWAHCCLGVACDLVAPDGWQGMYYHYTSGGNETVKSSMPSAAMMRDHYGLGHEGYAHLAGMNDSGASFLEIAGELREKRDRGEI